MIRPPRRWLPWRLRNVTPFEAVQTLCQINGLYFKKPTPEEPIGVVTTVKEFQEGLTVFREEKTQIYTLLYPNATELAAAIRNLYGDRVRLSRGAQDVFNETDDIQRRFERFDILDSRSSGLTQSLTSGGSNGSSSGGGSGGNSNSTRRAETQTAASAADRAARE